MGYYTRFDMSVYDGNYNSFDIAKYMLEKNKENDAFYAFEYDLEKFLKIGMSNAELLVFYY